MAAIRNVVVKIGGDISQLQKSLNKATKQVQGFGKGMTNIGKKLTMGVSAPLASIAVASVKTAADFETAMSEVKALSGATGKEFKALENKAKEMGAKTSKTAKESAEALKYMSLAGWDARTSMDALEPVLRLSEAGALDLGRASDLVTDSMSSLGLESKDLQKYLDQVAKTSSKSNTNIDMLMEAMVLAGGTFRNLNVPLAESNALIGILANRGIKGAESGHSLNSIIVNLTKKSGESAKALAALNLSAFDSQGKFKGVANVLKELNEKTKNMTEEQRNMYLTMIGGKTQINTLNALLDGVGKEYDDLKGKIEASDGSLKKMAKTMQDNLNGQLTRLKSQLEGLAIDLGQALLPYIKRFVDFLSKLADKFKKLSPKTKLVLTILGALGVVIPPLVLGLGTLITAIGTVASALSGLAVPIAIALGIGGIGAVIAKLKFGNLENLKTALEENLLDPVLKIIDKYKILGENTKDITKKIKEMLGLDDKKKKNKKETQIPITSPSVSENKKTQLPITSPSGTKQKSKIKAPDLSSFDELILKLKTIKDVAIGVFKQIGDVFSNSLKNFDFEPIKEAFENLKTAIGNLDPVLKIIGPILVGILSVLAGLANALLNALSPLISLIIDVSALILNFLNGFIALATGDFDRFEEIMVDWGNNIVAVFTDLWELVKGIFVGFVEGFLTVLLGFTASFGIDIGKMINDTVQDFKDMFGSIINFALNWKTDLIQKVLDLSVSIAAKIAKMVSDIVGKFEKLKHDTNNKFQEIKKVITDKLSSIAESALKWGKKIIQQLINGINQKKEQVKKKINEITSMIGRFFPSSPAKEGELKKTVEWGKKIVQQISDGISKGSKILTGKSANIGDQIKESLLGSISKLKTSDEISDFFDNVNSSLVSGIMDMQSKMDKYMNFTDLFSPFKVGQKSPSAFLVRNLETQVKGLKEWGTQLKFLKEKLGESSQLYQKMQSLDVNSLSQLKAVNNLTTEQLNEYAKLYSEKIGLANNLATQDINAELAQKTRIEQLVFQITGNQIITDDIEDLTNKIMQRLRIEGVY